MSGRGGWGIRGGWRRGGRRGRREGVQKGSKTGEKIGVKKRGAKRRKNVRKLGLCTVACTVLAAAMPELDRGINELSGGFSWTTFQKVQKRVIFGRWFLRRLFGRRWRVFCGR